MRASLIGFSFGVLLTLLYFASGTALQNTWLIDALVFLSTPIAYIVSWITGRTLEQEEGIYVYAFWAIPITIILLCTCCGLLYAAVRNLINAREEV